MSLGSTSGPTQPTYGLGDHEQSLWTDCGWSTVGQQFQTEQADSLDWDASLTGSTNDSKVSAAIPTLSNGKHISPLCDFNTWNAHPLRTVPFQYWGESQSGSSTSTFNTVSAGFFSSFHYFVDTFR